MPAEQLRKIFKQHSIDDLHLTSVECPACSFVIDQCQSSAILWPGMFWGFEITRFKCPGCDSLFGPISFIKTTNLKFYYDLLYSFYFEGSTSQIEAFNKINPILGESYVNYACGMKWGNELDSLMMQKFDVYGYDPSFTGTHPRINCKLELVDGIFSNNYIEHICDPVAQFIKWNSMLKMGGRMSHTGFYDSEESESHKDSPFHVIYMSEKACKIVSDKTGFSLDYYSPRLAKFTKIRTINQGPV